MGNEGLSGSGAEIRPHIKENVYFCNISVFLLGFLWVLQFPPTPEEILVRVAIVHNSLITKFKES